MRRIVTIVVLVIVAALVAWVLIPSSGRSAPVAPSSRIMSVLPAGDIDSGLLRLIPPASTRCATSDISTAAIPQVPARNGYDFLVLVSVQSRRTCHLQQHGQVTPLHPDGKPAAPAVILEPLPSTGTVTVSPGHAAELVINGSSGPACAVKPGTPRADLATAFTYDIGGATGRFQLLEAIQACPMDASLESGDALDVATTNETHNQPIVQVTVTAPATVDAGARFVAVASLHYNLTSTTVFDPCPFFSTQISPQSAEATTNAWTLRCAGMAPLEFGDVVNFSIPLTAPANLTTQTVDLALGFGSLSTPGTRATTTGPALYATTQLVIQGVGVALQPVAYTPLPPPPPPVPLQRLVSPPCTPADLRAGDLAPHALVPGAGNHSDYFTLTNITSAPCTLYKNAPIVLTGPGLAAVPVPNGTSLFAETVDAELEPAETTQVQFEFPNSCAGVDAKAVHYRDVVINLPAGPLVVPRPIDDDCGLSTGGAGVQADGPIRTGPLYSSYQPTDPEIDGTVSIKGPPSIARGVPATIEVTLEGQADWANGCPGYAITLGDLQTRHGLPCTIVHILPDVPATYDIVVEAPLTAPLGPTVIRFELLSGLAPAASQSVTITAG